MKIMFWVLFGISILGFIILGLTASYWHIIFNQSIEICAKNVVTAIQMTSACATLGNFTQDQIQDKTIEMFILNRTGAKA